MDENMTLATELLHEVKASAKRWFIAFCVMVGLEIATIIGFLWYISLPVEEYSIEQEATDKSLNLINGGDYIGGTAKGIIQEESDPQTE